MKHFNRRQKNILQNFTIKTAKQICQVYFKIPLWSLVIPLYRNTPNELQSYNVELCGSRIQSPAQITLLLLELHLGHIRRQSWRHVSRPASPRTNLCGRKWWRGVMVVVVKEFEHWYVCIWYMYRYMCKAIMICNTQQGNLLGSEHRHCPGHAKTQLVTPPTLAFSAEAV